MATKTKTSRTIRFCMRVGDRVGVLVKTNGRADGYWLKPIHTADFGLVSVEWQHETDTERVYTVEMGETRPHHCTCPARGECRHMAGTAKLIQMGVIR